VGRALTSSDFANSRLYDPEFTHRFRTGTAVQETPVKEESANG
jgi:precorrin-4/cobalt-precorrin-4 C11-methyltransferase